MTDKTKRFNADDFKVVSNKGPGQVVVIPEGLLMTYFGDEIKQHLAENGGHFYADATRSDTRKRG